MSLLAKDKVCIAEVSNMDHSKQHYYTSHKELNPSGIIAKGPLIDFTIPHQRDK